MPTSPGPSLTGTPIHTSFLLPGTPSSLHWQSPLHLFRSRPSGPLCEAIPELPAPAVNTCWAPIAWHTLFTIALLTQNCCDLCRPGCGLCTQLRAPQGADISQSLLSEQIECTNLPKHWFPRLQNGDNDNLHPAFLTGYPERAVSLFIGGILQVLSIPPPVIPSWASVLS